MNASCTGQPEFKTSNAYKKGLISRVFGLLLLLYALDGYCVDTAWTGATDNNWFNPNNWDAGGVPNQTTTFTTIPASDKTPIIRNGAARTGPLIILKNGAAELTSGSLTSGDNVFIDGSFKQTGGKNIANAILNVVGRYDFLNGQLGVDRETIIGIFSQSGGIHNVSNFLVITGRYDLLKGQLRTDSETINGTFNQSGGSHRVAGNLTINNEYVLNGGTINSGEIIVGGFGKGIFDHVNGANLISGSLSIGIDEERENGGAYMLKGGVLQADNEIIGGNTNTGVFNQSGGTNRVTDTLTINRKGTYNLSGGELQIGNLINNGNFRQSGGSISGKMTNNTRYNFSTGNFSGDLINNATVIFDSSQTETFNGNISGEGNVVKQNNGTTILTGNSSYTGGTTVSNGVLQGDTNSLQGNITNNATLVFNQASRGIFNGIITGSGNLVKENSGLLIFNNTQFYTGGTRIRGGNLQIGDDTHPGATLPGPVTIDPGSTLSGHGTVVGDVQNSGILSPGGSIGTLNVLGNVSYNTGSAFNIEISPQQSSLLNVSRNASLGSGSVNVIAGPGRYTPRSYTIMNADTISGNFGDVSLTSTGLNPWLDSLTPTVQVVKNPANATLGFRVDLTLDYISNPMGPLRSVIDKWLKTTLRTIGGRLNAPLGNACPKNSAGFWARGVGMISSADAEGSAPGFDGGTAGTVLGFDGQFGEDLTLGLAGFYARSEVTVEQGASQRSTADSLGLSLYGAYTPGPWQFKGVMGFANDSNHNQRLGLGSASSPLSSKTHANHVNGYGEVSYTFKTGAVSLQPLVGVQVGWMRQKGFTEARASGISQQNITFDGRTMYTLDALAGLRFRHEYKINDNYQTQTEIRLLYDHDFGTLQETVSARFNNRPIGPFNSSDRPDQRDAGILGASLALLSADSLNLYLDYNGEIRSGQQAHFIGAGIRYSW